MSTPITMPQLGESVTEGVVARWLKSEGDYVERDEPLVELITDKVNAEMPSPLSGTLVKIVAAEGETVAAGAELAQIEVGAATPATAGATPAVDGVAAASTNGVATAADGSMVRADDAGEHRRYSPVVKRLAQEHDVDLARVGGTGLSGRVTKHDVLAYVAGRTGQAAEAASSAVGVAADVSPPAEPALSPANISSAPPAPPVEPTPIPAPAVLAAAAAPVAQPSAVASSGASDEEYLPLTPMRRAIAEHMVRSKHTAPHATTMVEVDMTRFVRWRKENKDAVKARHGVDVTFVPIVIQAVVGALRAFPIMNASWGEDRLILKRRINIGVAIGLDDGLVVPVIHDAGDKSIVGLARAVHDLAERARTNRLTLHDMQGGTFTVNNVGVFGAVVSTPVINQPQAAILAMNAIVKRPVVLADDAIAVRSMMNLTMSFDHRIVDGLVSGRFLQRVVQNLDSIDLTGL